MGGKTGKKKFELNIEVSESFADTLKTCASAFLQRVAQKESKSSQLRRQLAVSFSEEEDARYYFWIQGFTRKERRKDNFHYPKNLKSSERDFSHYKSLFL